MLDLKSAACATALFAAPMTVSAQNQPGVSFDQTITTVASTAGHYDSSTSTMRQVSAGGNTRVEVTVNGMYPEMGPFSPGSHPVLLLRSGGTETVFMNTDSKEYMMLKPFEMMAGFKKMLEGMGGSMTVDSAATKVTFDSVGDGPTIDGHKTLHYRQGTTMKMTIAMMGQTTTVMDSSMSDIYSAPDLGEMNQLAAGAMEGITAVSQSMGFGKELFEKLSANQRRMRGFPLRLVKHSVKTQNANRSDVTETIESRNIKRVSVPDSAFAIPKDYKVIAMPVMPGAATEN